MKTLLLNSLLTIATLIMPLSTLAEVVEVYNSGQVVSAKPYLKDINLPNQDEINRQLEQQKEEILHKKIKVDHLLYPVKSEFSYGNVTKTKLDSSLKTAFIGDAIYLVGPDNNSIEWAQKNAEYLNQIHAFGIITNVDSKEQIENFQNQTGLTVMSARVAGLSSIIGINHYPFLIYNGWIVQ